MPAATTYTDPTAGKDTRRFYIVAVDTLGQEGFPTSPVWFNREWKQFYASFMGEWHSRSSHYSSTISECF